MRINNIIVSALGVSYLDNVNIHYLCQSVLEMNHLFKFNSFVSLEFVSSKKWLSGNVLFPEAEAVANNISITIFTDKFNAENAEKLILHEYVHVCIANTFYSVCPTWLNEGLAVYLSKQYDELEPICPDNIKEFYYSNQNSALFYNMALYTVRELIKRMSLSKLIEVARDCSSFSVDSMFGIVAIEKLIEKTKTKYRIKD